MPASRDSRCWCWCTVGHQQPGERGRDARRRHRPCAVRRSTCRQVAAVAVRRSARAARPPPPSPSPPGPFFLFRRAGLRGGACPARSPGSRQRPARPRAASAASIASSNPAFPSCAASRAAALSTQPGRDRHAQQHAHDLRGPLQRHVPVHGQQHRGGVQRRPVGHRARVRARRRLRERDRPAARARQARQRPLGHLPDDLHVDDLRPPRPAASAPSRPALQRRHSAGGSASFFSSGSGSRSRPFPWCPGWPPRLRSFRALPLGLLPRPPCLFRPDPLLRPRRPRVRAVHRQPPLQLRQPQLQPPPQLPLRLQLRRQHRDLLVLRLRSRPAAATPGHPAARRPRQAHRTRAASMLNLH